MKLGYGYNFNLLVLGRLYHAGGFENDRLQKSRIQARETFRKGRDNWKAKYKDAKYRAKLLADKVRYWKNKAAELERRVEKLERELSESEKKKL